MHGTLHSINIDYAKLFVFQQDKSTSTINKKIRF